MSCCVHQAGRRHLRRQVYSFPFSVIPLRPIRYPTLFSVSLIYNGLSALSPSSWRILVTMVPTSPESSEWAAKLDKIKIIHSTDAIATENSGTRGRSIWKLSSR